MKMKFHKWSFVLNRESDFRSDFRHIGPCRCRAPLCYRCRPPDLVGQRLRRTKDTSETWSDQDLWQWMGCLGKNAVNTMGFIVLYLSIYIYIQIHIFIQYYDVFPKKYTPVGCIVCVHVCGCTKSWCWHFLSMSIKNNMNHKQHATLFRFFANGVCIWDN
jgi:hypothetical protein